MSMSAPQDAVRGPKPKVRTRATFPGCQCARQHPVVGRHQQIKAHPIEPDHVTAVLLAYQTHCGLVDQLSAKRSRRKQLLSVHVRPRLPALMRQHVGCVVVTSVTLAHQEADEAGVRVVHLRLVPREADPRAVHDREVAGHRLVETDEAVVEDGNRPLGYDFRRDRHAAECNRAICRHLRLVIPVVEAGLLSGRCQARGLPPLLRRAAPDGRAEHDRLPVAGRAAVRTVGGRDAAGLSLRAQAQRLSSERDRHVRGAGPATGRSARPDPDAGRLGA